MSVQHVFHGEGNPNDLGIIAPAGSHFVNDLNSDEAWIATYSGPADGENPAYTGWVKLEQRWPVFETHIFNAADGYISDSEFFMSEGGELRIARDAMIYCNVQMELYDDNYWRYTSPNRSRVSITVSDTGNVTVIITELIAMAVTEEVGEI